MSPDEKQALIEKIDELPPEQCRRVEGYVDALVERHRGGIHTRVEVEGSSGSETSGRDKEGEEVAQANDRQEPQDRHLRQDWAGSLSDLKHEYTSLELEEEIKRQWTEMTPD